MKILGYFLFLSCFLNFFLASGQADSGQQFSSYTHRDSVRLAKTNTVSNLMLAGGIGLWGVGAYLITDGVLTYKSSPASGQTISQVHNQGVGLIGGGIAAIGIGAVLEAFGIRKKLEFKRRMKKMSLQGGLLDTGRPGIAASF